jgi:hypothetical protein
MVRGEVAAFAAGPITAYLIRRQGTAGPRRAGVARGQLPEVLISVIWP